MAASTECLLPGCTEEARNLKEGSPEVKKKSRGRPRRNGPEPCRPAANKADFFMPISRRKEQQKQALESSRSSEVSRNDPAPAKSKRCRQDDCVSVLDEVMSKKVQVGKGMQNAAKGPSPTKKDPAKSQMGGMQAAQRDAPGATGKRLHPFFTRQGPSQSKISKPVESRQGATGANALKALQMSYADGLLPCPPFHVTQLPEEENVQVESTFPFAEACKLSVRSSNLPDEESEGFQLCRNHKLALPLLDQVLGQFNNNIRSRLLTRLAAQPEQCVTTERDNVTSCAKQQEDQLFRYLSHSSSDSREHFVFEEQWDEPRTVHSREKLRERAASLKAGRSVTRRVKNSEGQGMCTLPSNPLWTDLYQPKSSDDVCGNITGVSLLTTWLASWQKKIMKGKKPCVRPNRKKGYVRNEDEDQTWEADMGSDSSDSDTESRKESLSSTLLITGPVGCGKTAAVYACAKEQGFSVIEVSTADLRNGSLIKHKFGEALESHGLRKWSANLENGIATALHTCEAESQTQLCSAETGSGCTEGAQGPQSNRKRPTVILFEDVDITFDDDRGFTSAIVKLAATTKRPIILTSNRRCPALPLPLRKLSVEFNQPCTQKLVLHACMVTNAEGLACCPQLMECIVKACRHDIRQVMMVLQFWSQGHIIDLQGLCSETQVQQVRHEDAVRSGTHACAHALMGLRSILLPLSFPFSLLGNVATKVSEAAMQLHQCAAYAGVIKFQGVGTPVVPPASCQISGEFRNTTDGSVADALNDDKGGGTGFAVCNSPFKSLKKLRVIARSLKLRRVEDACNEPGASQNVASCLNQQHPRCQAAQAHPEMCKTLSGLVPADAVCGRANQSECLSAAESKNSGASPDRVVECRELYEQLIEGSHQQREETVWEKSSEHLRADVMGKLSPRSSGLDDMLSDDSSVNRSLRGATRDSQNCEEQVQVVHHLLNESRLKACRAGDGELARQVKDTPSCTTVTKSCTPSRDVDADCPAANILRSPSASDPSAAAKEVTASEKQACSLEVVTTMARLADDLSFFDAMCSHSAWELEDCSLEGSMEQHSGFHRDSLEDEAAYLVDRSVHLCHQQCSRLMELADPHRPSMTSSSNATQDMQSAEPMLDAFNWLASDANPCDVDHGIRQAAREAQLRNIVQNLLPSRAKAAAAGRSLHEYTTSLAHICKLEQRRQAVTGKQIRPGTRRSGRGFLHYLASLVPESDIACLLKHAKLE